MFQEGLVVSAGGSLDFGDCFTGEVTEKPLTLRNIGDVPIDIRLSTEPAVNVRNNL